ncbi:MAG: hypothetical protein AAFQ43_13785, partial [Bacteroidota bacterium]
MSPTLDLVPLGRVGGRGAPTPEGARLCGVLAETTAETAAWAEASGATPFAHVGDLAAACRVVAVASD